MPECIVCKGYYEAGQCCKLDFVHLYSTPISGFKLCCAPICRGAILLKRLKIG